MSTPPVVIFAAQYLDIQQKETRQRPNTLCENVGDIEAVKIREGVFGHRPAAHHALVLITLETGNFQEGMQAV
jgi:hypothetical protein